MNAEEFLNNIKNLPPDTPLTASHVAGILEVINSSLNKPLKKATDFDSLSNSQLIDENLLAEWISEPVKTIQHWRLSGKIGLEYQKNKSGSVRYKVGTVRDWIDGNTISNTAQGTAKGILKLEGYTFNPPIPLINYGEKSEDFFESLIRDDEPIGYSMISYEYYSEPKESIATWMFDLLKTTPLSDIEASLTTLLSNGVDINQKSAIYKEGAIKEFTIANLMADFEGADYGYGDLLITLLDNNMDVSKIHEPKDQFSRGLSSYNFYKKLNDSLNS